MKKQFLNLIIAVAMMASPFAVAESTNETLKVVGSVGAAVGTGFFIGATIARSSCKDDLATATAGSNAAAVLEAADCISKAEDLQGVGIGIGLVGAVTALYGFSQDNKRIRFRGISNGVAIEKNGTSFSTTVFGKIRLQKEWKF